MNHESYASKVNGVENVAHAATAVLEAPLDKQLKYDYPDDTPISKREQIVEIVEPPLVAACQLLYDLNIRTTCSSANHKDAEHTGMAYITIDFVTLSEPNKIIAKQLGEEFRFSKSHLVRIDIPLDPSEQVVSDRALAIAAQFEPQKPLWIHGWTFDELLKFYSSTREDYPTPQDLVNDLNTMEGYEYYYDQESGIIFDSKELCDKVKQEQFAGL
jgi:hypothetical protein